MKILIQKFSRNKGFKKVKFHERKIPKKININININIKPIVYIFILLMLIYLIIIILKSTKIFHNNKNLNYYFCVTAAGKMENRYARELVSYYLNIGAEKFVFYDNNNPNTEKLADVLGDYINNGIVDIIEVFGNSSNQATFNKDMYDKYNKSCEWIAFFDFDEYLVLKYKGKENLKVKEFFSLPIFKECEAIEFNWLMYNDNGLVYDDKRTSVERFTNPVYSHKANRFIKSVVRGNLSKPAFLPEESDHHPQSGVSTCDSEGKKDEEYIGRDDIIPPKFDNGYLMHFNTRTADEYANKILRGEIKNVPFDYDDRLRLFFELNDFTPEKLAVFEKKLKREFPEYHSGKK